jgi:fluoroquinolone resistance protein
MKLVNISDETFTNIDYTQMPLLKGEYEGCKFLNCDFSNADLSEIKFSECELVACNLSLAKLVNTALREVRFKECKMLGLRFDQCNTLGLAIGFEQCTLNHSSFYKIKLKKTIVKNSQLHEVDFTECDLTGSIFDTCDLMRATFENTILEKADLRTSFNYSIDPEINRLKKSKFSLPAVLGLLYKYDIEIDRV